MIYLIWFLPPLLKGQMREMMDCCGYLAVTVPERFLSWPEQIFTTAKALQLATLIMIIYLRFSWLLIREMIHFVLLLKSQFVSMEK